MDPTLLEFYRELQIKIEELQQNHPNSETYLLHLEAMDLFSRLEKIKPFIEEVDNADIWQLWFKLDKYFKLLTEKTLLFINPNRNWDWEL